MSSEHYSRFFIELSYLYLYPFALLLQDEEENK